MTQAKPLIRPQFWQHYRLDELNRSEWEALCDGCGQCCLVKLQDEDTAEVVYTDVACQLLDTQTGRCSNYPQRQQYISDCIQLVPELIPSITWLPSTCAYRRVYEGKPLPSWHYLLTGDRQSVVRAKKSVAGRCLSETEVPEDELEEHVIRWVR